MALEASALIAPVGELAPDLFDSSDPAGNTATRVEALLNAAPAGITDAAKAAWIYARMFRAKANELAALPASMSVDGESQGFARHQIDHFRTLATQWQAVYDETTAADVVPTPPRSRSVRGKVVW